MLNAQYELVQKHGFQVVIIVTASRVAGGESVHVLKEWLDARLVDPHGMGDPSDEKRDRPPMWRFWRRMPRRGQLAILDRSCYGRALEERLEGYCNEYDWMRA